MSTRRQALRGATSLVLAGALGGCARKLVYVPPDLVRRGPAILRELAVPLPSAQRFPSEAGHPLQAWLERGKWIGMGEATHGSREFFDWKIAMTKHLIAHHDLRLVVLEVNFAGARQLDRYVMGEPIEREAAIVELWSWPSQSESYAEFWTWLRNHNAKLAPHERVRVFGCDIQGPERELAAAREYLRRHGASRSDVLSAAEAKALLADARHGASEAGLIARRHAELATSSSDAKRPRYGSRDTHMARNVAWLANVLGFDRGVVWAHNAHVSTATRAHAPTLGAHLRGRFASDYVAVGFAFAHGSFVARRNKPSFDWRRVGALEVFRRAPPIETGLDAVLDRVRPEDFALDMRHLDEDAVAILGRAWPFYEVGAAFQPPIGSWLDDLHYGESRPAADYDVLVFLHHVMAAKLLPPWQS